MRRIESHDLAVAVLANRHPIVIISHALNMDEFGIADNDFVYGAHFLTIVVLWLPGYAGDPDVLVGIICVRLARCLLIRIIAPKRSLFNLALCRSLFTVTDVHHGYLANNL